MGRGAVGEAKNALQPLHRGGLGVAKNALQPPHRRGLQMGMGGHMERGWMPLHDAVAINCKKVATTENHGSGVKYMG